MSSKAGGSCWTKTPIRAKPAILVEGPEIKRDNGKLTITFALNKNDDVLVRVVDAEGNIVRNLACGVLGENAPKLFQKGSVKQKIVWDGKDDQGKPVLAGCKVCVAVGLRPRFERFVADDPTQLLNHICGMEVDQQGRVYVTQFTERRGEPEVRRYNRDGEYLETVYPPNPNHLRGELAEVFSHVDDVDGRAIPRRRGAWPFFHLQVSQPLRVRTHKISVSVASHLGRPRVHCRDCQRAQRPDTGRTCGIGTGQVQNLSRRSRPVLVPEADGRGRRSLGD